MKEVEDRFFPFLCGWIYHTLSLLHRGPLTLNRPAHVESLNGQSLLRCMPLVIRNLDATYVWQTGRRFVGNLYNYII